MKKEVRTIVYDEDLRLEAYRFEGIMQPFPNHFHEYYVVGFVEGGERRLSCKNREYAVGPGDMLLFCPGESHACVQNDGGALDYRAFNIPQETMLDLAQELTGRRTLPGFARNVFCDREAACYLRPLHDMIMVGDAEFEKEEYLLLLLRRLLQRYGQALEDGVPVCRDEIERACAFMEEHYAGRLALAQICGYAGLSKSTLLRAFTKEKGVTPYRYLENIRIGAAKKLLEQGVPPAEAALQTGFSDQSHFTNYFTRFIGLSPGVYRDIFSDKGGKRDGE